MIAKNKDDKRNVAIYCRVSTEEQAQGEYTSLDSQEDILSNHCTFKNWKKFKIYREVGSAKNLNRPMLQNLLTDAQDGKFSVVLITRLDRISRSLKDFLQLIEKFETLDIESCNSNG